MGTNNITTKKFIFFKFICEQYKIKIKNKNKRGVFQVDSNKQKFTFEDQVIFHLKSEIKIIIITVKFIIIGENKKDIDNKIVLNIIIIIKSIN